eukprot:gene6451-6680_t
MASICAHHREPVYLVDFSVYKPPEELRVNLDVAQERGRQWSMYSEGMKDFMVKVVERSGLSQSGTYLPAPINPMITPEPRNDITAALQEAKEVMTGAVEELLAKTGLRPQDIDILVTNCSIFCPTPSLASMLVNHFKFRPDIQGYNLGGMGCGNGVMAVGLVRDLLQARPNSVALFVPAEITTYAFYPGRHKQFMVANCIFRMGGAAICLSNKPGYRRTAKYQLTYNVRVHTGQSDESYNCMSWGPDPDGVNGVYLGKNVVTCAAGALQTCLATLTPRIMTWAQYAEASVNLLGRKFGAAWPSYMPDFTKCIDHFAIHAGGYAVLKGIQGGLSLPAAKMLPSFAALRDYGNTSCSTTWYVMAYMESCDEVLKGHKIMQVGMGGGMKAGINVWLALRNNNNTVHKAWRHLAARPLTEADLPRPIQATAQTQATYNGCKWRGQVLRVELAKPDFRVKLQQEWLEDQELEQQAASDPQDAAFQLLCVPATTGSDQDEAEASSTIRLLVPGPKRKSIVVDLASKAKSHRCWFPVHKEKRLADLDWEPLPPSKRQELANVSGTKQGQALG